MTTTIVLGAQYVSFYARFCPTYIFFSDGVMRGKVGLHASHISCANFGTREIGRYPRQRKPTGLPRLGVRSRESLIVDVYIRSAELQEATSRSHDPETGWRLY